MNQKRKLPYKDLHNSNEVYSKLIENEKKYRTLFETIDEGFCIIKVLFDNNKKPVDYRFLEVNPAFEEQTGLKEAEGKRMREMAPNHEEHWFEIYGEVALTRESVRFERPAKSLDRYFNVYAFPFGEPENNKVAVLFRDISERKQIEKELRESKERLSTALEIDTVGVLFWGSDFSITKANDAFLNMSGFSYEEAIGKTWQELTPKEFYPASKKAVSDIQETGYTEPYEKQYFRKDGSRWWGLFAPRQINDRETVEYVLDITDRKHREQRDQFLLKLNDTLRSVSDLKQIRNKAIQLLQEELNANRVLFIESTSSGQFVVKSDITNQVPSIEGEIDLSDFGTNLVNTLQAGETYIERDAQTDSQLKSEEKKNYQKIDVRSKIAVPLVKNDELIVVLATEKADPYDWSKYEIALVEETAERTWAYIERLRAEQKLVALKDSLEDRVKKRTKALRSYQEQLRSLASRLNEAEQNEQHRLAAELHDNLGQLLSIGKMKIQNLEKEDLPDKTVAEITDLAELIDDALTYTRELMSDLKPPPALDKEDFGEVLNWVVKKMEKHELEVKIEDDNKPKPLNEEIRTTLQQSIKELLFNIVKYADVNEAHVTVSRKQDMIQVVVEDNGKGFNMEGNKPVPTQEGGFGLFNIRERMNYLNGELKIFSKPGEGTKAVLLAPLKKETKIDQSIVKDQQVPQSAARKSAIANASQKIKILIADDHKMVRRGLRNLIESQDDMTIIAEAADGREALNLARKTNPNVIVMDVNMPVMDGIEATRKITSNFPNIHIIGLSLHDNKEVAKNMRSAGAMAYLTKDEAFEALCATIRSEAVSLKNG